MRIAIKKKLKVYNECEFYPATEDIFDLFIASVSGYYKTTVLNLQNLNKEIGKTRRKGEFVKSHLCSVRDQILNAPVVEVVEKLGTWAYRVKLLPFDEVQKTEENEEILNAPDVVVEAENADTETDTKLVAEDAGLTQQQLIYANQKAKSHNIDFGVKGLKEIAKYPREILDKVFLHYQFACQHNHIPSSTGWIIRNLQQKWHRNFKPETMVKCITDKYFELQDLLLESFGTIPTRYEQLNLLPKKSDPPTDITKGG